MDTSRLGDYGHHQDGDHRHIGMRLVVLSALVTVSMVAYGLYQFFCPAAQTL